MKIKISAILILALTGVICAAKPRLIQTEKSEIRAGVKYRKMMKHFFFNQSEMTYNYLLDPANKMVKQKWGDYELGLRHGRILNGSWCMWNFFSCVMPDKSALTNQVPAERVALMSTAEGVHAEIVWPELTLKMIQLNNAREWIFMEVTVKETPSYLRLRSWPGGAKWKPADGGVRRLKTLSMDEAIPVTRMKFRESSGGLALYNRNYSENNGNFLLFEPEKYIQTYASSSNVVMLDFVPKPGEKVFHFALGYFLNEDPQDACGRFLKERMPNIAALLKQVKWKSDADFSDFHRHTAVIENLLNNAVLSAEEKNTFQTELDRCRSRFNTAEKNQDIPAAYHEIEIAEQLRSKVGMAALKSLQ